MLFYLASFILLLGPLVFVHELGHFLFAKLFNVRVDAFSMGFGPKFFKKKWGETEYCLSVIPLGGYVKLYGQDPSEVITPELKNRALSSLEPWKRFLVFVGGPLFNFIFAIMIFAFMLILGEPQLAPNVGRVVPGSQAFTAGFRSGDQIAAIDRTVITSFEEINRIITESPNKMLSFRVKREGTTKEVKVSPRPVPGLSIYGEAIEVGSIEGFFGIGRAAVVGISNPNSAAAKAGIKTGDLVESVEGVVVKNYESLEKTVDQLISQKVGLPLKVVFLSYDPLEWATDKNLSSEQLKARRKEASLPRRRLRELGIHSSELFVSSLVKGSPAEKAGLQPGDRLVAVNKTELQSFLQLKDLVQHVGEASDPLTISVERQGKHIDLALEPTVNDGADQVGPQTKQFMIGVFPLFVSAEPDLFQAHIFNPFTLTVEAWSRALDLSAKTFISIKKLIFRQVSMGTLGGPILIGKLAGDSMTRGIAQFLKVMAMISISLAVFNILPIPVLDGGHIFLLLVEIIRGRPISMRQTEVVQQVGLSLIVLLLVVVLFNDFSRVGIPALRNIFQ